MEDLYLPFKPKRKTRASVARALGLQPLADMLFGRAPPPASGPLQAAARFAGGEGKAASAQEALAGARDIVAEEVAVPARARVRRLWARG